MAVSAFSTAAAVTSFDTASGTAPETAGKYATNPTGSGEWGADVEAGEAPTDAPTSAPTSAPTTNGGSSTTTNNGGSSSTTTTGKVATGDSTNVAMLLLILAAAVGVAVFARKRIKEN